VLEQNFVNENLLNESDLLSTVSATSTTTTTINDDTSLGSTITNIDTALIHVHDIPRIANGHIPVTSRMTACIDNWTLFLQNDFDAEYLLDGVAHGFRVISADIKPPSTLSKNYKSATLTNKVASEKQILTEIELDR
jgi:hypothetical protein